MKIKKLAQILLILAIVVALFTGAAALGEESGTGEVPGATQTDLDSDEGGEPVFMDDPEPVIAYNVSGETLTLQGDAVAEGDNTNVTAVNITSTDGAKSAVSVEGSVSAQGTSSFYSHATSAGMEIYSAGQGSDAEAVISEGVSSVMQWTNYEEGDNINCAGISVSVEEGGSAEVTVEQGGVYAEAHGEDSDNPPYTWAAGVHLYNTDGKADIRVTGDVTAESYVYGVGLNSHLYGIQKASTLIIVDGDVYGKTRAIWAEHANPGASMEIIVNGTVSGDTDPIWVDGSERDSILITVWKTEPSEDGALVVVTDNEENQVRSEEAEKALQYIIRISPEDEDKVQIDAREYYGYLIAREGDQVRIRVSAPAGRRIKAVYADENQSVELEQAGDGSYLLTVPWDGGFDCFAVRAVGTPDGKLSIQLDAGQLKALSDKAFIALVYPATP